LQRKLLVSENNVMLDVVSVTPLLNQLSTVRVMYHTLHADKRRIPS